MVYSFQAETVLYTLAAVGIAAILREGWLWLFRRPSAEKAIPMLLSLTRPVAAEDMDYILSACDEIRRYYFPGLTVCVNAETQESVYAERTDQN